MGRAREMHQRLQTRSIQGSSLALCAVVRCKADCAKKRPPDSWMSLTTHQASQSHCKGSRLENGSRAWPQGAQGQPSS